MIITFLCGFLSTKFGCRETTLNAISMRRRRIVPRVMCA